MRRHGRVAGRRDAVIVVGAVKVVDVVAVAGRGGGHRKAPCGVAAAGWGRLGRKGVVAATLCLEGSRRVVVARLACRMRKCSSVCAGVLGAGWLTGAFLGWGRLAHSVAAAPVRKLATGSSSATVVVVVVLLLVAVYSG